MISSTRSLLLVFISIRSSVGNLTDDSTAIYSNYTVNYNNYIRGCEKKMCLRKCCPSGFYYHHEGNFTNGQLIGRCEKDYSTNFGVSIFDKTTKIQDLYDGFSVGMISCPNNYEMVELNLEHSSFLYVYIQQNGTWYVPSYNTSYNSNKNSCVDVKNGMNIVYYCREIVNIKVLFRKEGGYIVSLPFLLATALVYAILSKRNIYTKALISHTVCLSINYMILIVDGSVHIENIIVCKTLGHLRMYFFYATQNWLNVMCIDMWLTFSGRYGFGTQLSQEKLCIILSIFAWGLAGLYMLVIHFIATSCMDLGSCYFSSGCIAIVVPSFWFRITLITILSILNTLLYILTSINIRRSKKEAGVLKCTCTCTCNANDSARHIVKVDNRFTLYWNLLWVMSTFCIITYISIIRDMLAMYGWYNDNCFRTFVFYMYVLYPPVIFYVFVCKKEIWKNLKERYRQVIAKFKDSKKSSTPTVPTPLFRKYPSEVAGSDVRLTRLNNLNVEGI